MLLTEHPHIDLTQHGGPIYIYARHHGSYTRKILVHWLDMRFEDNPEIPKLIQHPNATWIAQHPIEDLYIVYDGLRNIYNTRVTPQELQSWITTWTSTRQEILENPAHRLSKAVRQLPPDIYKLPGGWWEWCLALDKSYGTVKAPKRPRPGEPTPEEIDEKGGESPTLETRLSRIRIYI